MTGKPLHDRSPRATIPIVDRSSILNPINFDAITVKRRVSPPSAPVRMLDHPGHTHGLKILPVRRPGPVFDSACTIVIDDAIYSNRP